MCCPIGVVFVLRVTHILNVPEARCLGKGAGWRNFPAFSDHPTDGRQAGFLVQ